MKMELQIQAFYSSLKNHP